MHYVKALRFDDRPDYGYLKRLLRQAMIREGLHYDFLFDWSFITPPKKREILIKKGIGNIEMV